MSMPRVAYVLTQDRGGPVDVTVALARHLHEAGLADVRIFGPRPTRASESVSSLVEEVAVGAKHQVSSIRLARRRILNWRPDVIHAQDRRAGLVCMPSLAGQRRAVTPVVHTYHGVPDGMTQAWFAGARHAARPSWYALATLAADAVLARRMTRTVVPSPSMGTFLHHRLHVPLTNLVHIDNGLPPLPPSPPTSMNRFLFVGLLVERKGVDLLLRAFARAHAQRPHIRLQVVGSGPANEDLQNLARALAVGDVVTFSGFRADVPTVLAHADAFVLPSRMEQQPLVLIEAMGAAKPVLATDTGGVADMLAGAGQGAIVVPPDDESALSLGLLRLADLPDPRTTGLAVSKVAGARFSVERCADRHLALYQSLLRE